MGQIVNLRLARKAKKRAEDAKTAQTNRARHGLSKTERRLIDDEAERLANTVEGARRQED